MLLPKILEMILKHYESLGAKITQVQDSYIIDFSHPKPDLEKLQEFFHGQATFTIHDIGEHDTDDPVYNYKQLMSANHGPPNFQNLKHPNSRYEMHYEPPAPPGVAEARRKFEAQMAIADSSKRIKPYTKDELIGIELMSRDDELIRKQKEN